MVTQFALARPLVAFQASHPGLQLRLRQGGAEEIARWVLAGDVELGIVAERESCPELAVEPLMRLPNVAVVRAGSRLARLPRLPWRVLLQQPLVMFPQNYHQRWLIDHQAAKRGVAPRIALESENLGVIFEAVRAGLGVSTMPALAVQRQRQLATVRLETDDVLTVAACTRQGFPHSRATQELLQHLRGSLTLRH